MLETNTIVDGKYRILRQLGEGGMAVVYEAENTRLGNRFALKEMHRALGTTRTGIDRFLREATTLAKLNHPNIVRVHDVVTHDGVPILVMELLEGHALDDLVYQKQRFTHEQIYQLASEMLDALHYAHEHGFIHRDVKPGNIFQKRVTSGSYSYCLMDFGIVRDTQDASLTMTGHMIGTQRYASPEQIQSPRSVDARSDLYSLGVTLWEIITGNQPFATADTDFAIMKVITENPYLSIPTEFGDPHLSRFIERLTQNNRDDRFSNAEEALNFLRGTHTHESSSYSNAPSYLATNDAQPSPQDEYHYSDIAGENYNFDDIQVVGRLAESGDVDAQAQLGYMLHNGIGIAQNHTEALYWTNAAAQQGNPAAQYNMGLAWLHGWGVEPDPNRAQEWFQIASNNGFAEAGMMLRRTQQAKADNKVSTTLGCVVLFFVGFFIILVASAGGC